MKPYPRYKTTGLAWLPSVPEHWEVVRGKQLFRPIDERSKTGSEQLLSVSERHGVVLRKNANVTMFMAQSYEGYKLCWPDDLAINCLWAWSYGLGFSHDFGIISTAYSVFRLKDKKQAIPWFYDYFLRSSAFHWEMRVRSKGLWKSRYQLSDADFLSAPMILPPPSEQERIVRYLDEKTTAIDELVRAKEREIELLRERKQVLISATVTGGLDPATERKDSGFPWIGKIPEGWQIEKLSRRYSVQLGKMLDSKKIKGDSLLPYLRNQDVQWDNINSNDLPQMDFSDEERRRFGVQKGDLLVCEGGEIGRCAIWESENPCCFQKALIRLRPRNPTEDSVRFMWYLMCAATANHAFDFATGKATIAHLPAEKLSASQFAFPPLPEQQRIVARLDAACSRLAAAEAAIRKQITLLHELRTRLVSDAVTGAVEV